MTTPSDSPRVARHKALFVLFDLNRDGALDVSDFATIEERCARFQPGAAPGFEEIAYAARLRLTQFRKADVNADQRVTEAEWLAWCAKEYQGTALSAEGEAFARNLFRTLDVNRDNALDLGDYAYAHLAHGLDPSVSKLEAAFSALDANHSGKVSLAEFLKVFARYVASDEGDVPALLVA